MDNLVSLLLGASIDETMVRCIALIAIIEFTGSIFCLIGSFNRTR